jgi:predicted O-linked N-acetylglucosamine transferase (SPINDLY family)
MPQFTIQQAFDLALQHHRAGRLNDADTLYRLILSYEPQNADAMHLLGVTSHQAGQNDVALDLIRRAIALKPNFSQAQFNLGNVLHANGQLDDAVIAFRQAIASAPGYAQAHYNLGNVLNLKGQPADAIIALRQAIAVNPSYAKAYSYLGGLLASTGRLDEAIAACRKAIALEPGFADAYANLGVALHQIGQLDEAVAACRAAITLNPALPEAHSNLGNVLKDKGELDEAISCYRKALELNPNLVAAHDNLLLALHYHHASDAQILLGEKRRWNLQHAQPLKRFIEPHHNAPDADRRLRIGYVSPNFCDHPVGRFALPLLAGRDRAAFDIYCYATAIVPDQITAQLRSYADAWCDIAGLSDEHLARIIRQDRIDILVDLAMHTEDNRLLVFARKPAPVQITYLAYAGGTALDTIDFRLTDRYLNPSETEDRHYLEKSIRLDGSYWCYQPNAAASPVNELPALTSNRITLGCLNSFCKINEPTLSLWAQILNRVPDSSLLMVAPEGTARERTLDRFRKDGIVPERIQFVARQPVADYLRTYHRIDIALDPLRYNGGTTTCDALWMGVPVITLAGSTAMGRAGVSILTNAGLHELIAHSPQDYVQIAAALALDLPRLATLRNTMRPRISDAPLLDTASFVRSIESAYRQAWRTWCEAMNRTT